MPTLAPADVASPAEARPAHLAERNWQANRAALAKRQPTVAELLDGVGLDWAWATARDGSLSARDANGQWVGGCSVPRLAGRALLRSLDRHPGGHCLLAPAHAGLVSAARERLGPDPVLFVVQPNSAMCRLILRCDDFSTELAAGRMWWAAGENWVVEFHRWFDAHPGLATPTRFVQTKLTPAEVVEPLMAAAQQVIDAVATTRTTVLDGRCRAQCPLRRGRTLLVTGSRFRLWDTAAEPLLTALSGVPGTTVVRYDTDDPLTAAPLALLDAAEGVSAVVAADVGRANAMGIIPERTRWVTWVTRPIVPPAAGAGPDDRVILADQAWAPLATAAGWPADRVCVGRCPSDVVPGAPPTRPTVGLLADTRAVVVPESVRSYSSHLLLWESIAAELDENPFAVTNIAEYLLDRAGQMNVDPTELDVAAFADGLVQPAFEQALARELIYAGVPVRLWGAGWTELPEFADRAAGPIGDQAALRSAVRTCSLLVRHTPGRDWHPLHACGRPVITSVGHTPAGWVARVRAALEVRENAATTPATPALSDALRAVLASV